MLSWTKLRQQMVMKQNFYKRYNEVAEAVIPIIEENPKYKTAKVLVRESLNQKEQFYSVFLG